MCVYYMCVGILIQALCVYTICVLACLYVLLYMCPHTTIYVSSYRRADDTVRATSEAEREQVLEFTALASSCLASWYTCTYADVC
jgi:hypothetical protein